MLKSFCKFGRADAELFKHPFHCVAVMTEQAARLVVFMAMVRGYLLPFLERLPAYGACAALGLEKGFNQLLTKPSPSFPLVCNSLRPPFWVCFFCYVKLFCALFCGLSLRVSPPLVYSVRFCISCLALFFDVLTLVVFATLSANLLVVLSPVFTVIREICSPFFWGASSLRFWFSHDKTQSYFVARSITLKGI